MKQKAKTTNMLRISEAYRLTSPDRKWIETFESLERVIRSILYPTVQIEHIGSTSIPIDSKPVVDILVGVESKMIEETVNVLQAKGLGQIEGLKDTHGWLRVGSQRRIANIHVVQFDGKQWLQRIMLRDALREDSALALQYQQLKYNLKELYPNNVGVYTEGKWPFIQDVLRIKTD